MCEYTDIKIYKYANIKYLKYVQINFFANTLNNKDNKDKVKPF